MCVAAAITATGVIWSRYSTQITPVNYNLLAVNAFMAVTGFYQLSRKIRCELAAKRIPLQPIYMFPLISCNLLAAGDLFDRD